MRRAHGKSRRGVSAIEVLLAFIVLVVVLLPVLGLSQSQERESYFLEFDLMAQRRCRAMIDLVLTDDIVAVERGLSGKFRPGSDGVAEATVPVPTGLEGLARMEHMPARDVDRPTPAGGRLALYSDELALGRAIVGAGDATHLYRIRARTTWRFPGDPTSVAPHVHEMTRLAMRPGLTHQLLQEVH